MELSNLLSDERSINTPTSTYSAAAESQLRSHSYPTRQTMSGINTSSADSGLTTSPAPYVENKPDMCTTQNITMSLHGSATPKSVAFELLFPESPQLRARLPMRVQIYPHDTTESIVTTVKNFYGLYAGPGGAKGVSFEDEQGQTLIAQYENLRNNMTVYVRVIDEASNTSGTYGPSSYHSASPVDTQNYHTAETHQMAPPHPAHALSYGQPPSRPTSRTSLKRSVSPNGRGRRSDSASASYQATKKSRSRSGYKSRGSSTHGSFADVQSDNMNGYSSGDGAGSVSSRTKSEHLGNTEISLDNIVEGGRRKRAKFESSVSRTYWQILAELHKVLTLDHNLRNCPYLRLLKCLPPRPILRCPQLDELSIKEYPSHTRILHKIPSRTLNSCNLHRAMGTASASLACTQRLPLTAAVHGVRHILNQDCPLVRCRTEIVWAYYLHQILLLVAVCLKRIRMWLYSL